MLRRHCSISQEISSAQRTIIRKTLQNYDLIFLFPNICFSKKIGAKITISMKIPLTSWLTGFLNTMNTSVSDYLT